MPAADYITIQNLRDEGITESMLSDARAAIKITEWSNYVDRITGQWFNSRARTLYLDSKTGPSVRVGHPIIQIDEMYFCTGRGDEYEETEVSVDGIRVYNRHLTQGLTRPDDRMAPRIEFPGDLISDYYSPYHNRPARAFDTSRLAIKLVGFFGYTELQTGDTIGETSNNQVPISKGHTPYLIEKAVKLLVLRDMPQLIDTGARQDFRTRWALKSEKTADQSYTMADVADIGQAGGWTGDPEVDMFLSMFVSTVGGLGAEVV